MRLQASAEGGPPPRQQESAQQQASQPAKPFTDERTAFVKSLRMEVEQAEVEALFATCGDLTTVRLMRDRATNRSRVIFLVDYSSGILHCHETASTSPCTLFMRLCSSFGPLAPL